MLVLCTQCNRHVRAEETACPFCRGKPSPARPMAVVALVAVGAAAFVACGREEPRAMYGAPPIFFDGGTQVKVIPPDDAGRD